MTRDAFRFSPASSTTDFRGGLRGLAGVRRRSDSVTDRDAASSGMGHREGAATPGCVLTEKSFDPAELTQRVPLRTLLSAIQRSSEPTGRPGTPSLRN
jgi:hypothetical protein